MYVRNATSCLNIPPLVLVSRKTITNRIANAEIATTPTRNCDQRTFV